MIEPMVRQVAADNGAVFHKMDTKDLHKGEGIVFLPTLKIYSNEQGETILEGASFKVGDIEKALGKNNNFLSSIKKTMETAVKPFEGVVQIDANGRPQPVSYADRPTSTDDDKYLRALVAFFLLLIVLLAAFFIGKKMTT